MPTIYESARISSNLLCKKRGILRQFRPCPPSIEGNLAVVPIDELGDQARRAGAVWARTTFKERADCLGRLRNLIIEEMDAIAGGLHLVTGKTPAWKP